MPKTEDMSCDASLEGAPPNMPQDLVESQDRQHLVRIAFRGRTFCTDCEPRHDCLWLRQAERHLLEWQTPDMDPHFCMPLTFSGRLKGMQQLQTLAVPSPHKQERDLAAVGLSPAAI